MNLLLKYGGRRANFAFGLLIVFAATLVASGVAIAMYLPKPVSLGAWLTAAVLFAFAFVGRHVARQEEGSTARLPG